MVGETIYHYKILEKLGGRAWLGVVAKNRAKKRKLSTVKKVNKLPDIQVQFHGKES